MMKVQLIFNGVLKLNAFFAAPDCVRQRGKAKNKLLSAGGSLEA
jgi:hypothetical protein